MYEHHSSRLLPWPAFIRRLARHGAFVAAMVAGSLGIGIAGYMTLAHMRFVDAFVNSAMLLGGMGPVGELPNDGSKWFAGFFALYAGLVFIVAASVLFAPIAHRILHKLHLDKK
jgi:hypothetical protein